MRKCTKCGEEKPYSDFYYQTGFRRDGERDRNPRYSSWCKKCSCIKASEDAKLRRKNTPEREKEKDRRSYQKNKVWINKNSKARSKAQKQRCVDYLGGKCMICGYNKCLGAMDFHHREPSEKEFSITQVRYKLEKLKPELDKCDLLCSNCHKEIHYNQKF